MINIKQATAQDAQTIQKLLKALAGELGKEDDYNGSEESLLEYGFGEASIFEAMIAWQDDLAVGLALYFNEFSTWRGEPGVYVQDLYVSANARSQGVGKKLLAAVIAKVQKNGATYMRLSVYKNNHKGAAFYNARGFDVAEDEKIYLLERGAFKTLGELDW